MQSLREKLYWIDSVLYTHPHADHLHGIDELRSYNFLMKKVINCYGNRWTIDEIRNKFDYIFKYSQEGGGKPAIDLHEIKASKKIKIDGIEITPIGLIHGKMPVLGYRINDVAYLTDFSEIPEKSMKLLKNLDVLVIDCLRFTEHPTHVNSVQALEYVEKIGAKRTFLTHMTHELEYLSFKKQLPKGVEPAYDGLKLVSKS